MGVVSQSRRALAMAVVLLGALSLCAAAFAAPTWSMKDIDSLTTAKAWRELLAGAENVPPSARASTWSSLVAQAARGRLQELVAESSNAAQAQDIVDLVVAAEAKYTFLVQDAAYLKAKGAAIDSVLRFCEKSRAPGCGACLEALARGLSTLPKGASQKIALLMEDEGRMPSQTLRFWAIAAEEDAASCDYGGLQNGTVAALADDNDENGSRALHVVKLCYTKLETPLIDHLSSVSKGSPYTARVCPILKAHGKRTMFVRDKCP